MFGFGRADLVVSQPRVSTPWCTHICPQFNRVNGCGKADAPWRLNSLDDNICVICHEFSYEDRLHLFFNCNFSRRVWNYLSIDWSRGPDIQQCIQHASSSFRHPFFFEVMLTAAWNIWILRNGRTFRGERATFAAWRSNFVHDLPLLTHRLKDDTSIKLKAWINALV